MGISCMVHRSPNLKHAIGLYFPMGLPCPKLRTLNMNLWLIHQSCWPFWSNRKERHWHLPSLASIHNSFYLWMAWLSHKWGLMQLQQQNLPWHDVWISVFFIMIPRFVLKCSPTTHTWSGWVILWVKNHVRNPFGNCCHRHARASWKWYFLQFQTTFHTCEISIVWVFLSRLATNLHSKDQASHDSMLHLKHIETTITALGDSNLECIWFLTWLIAY